MCARVWVHVSVCACVDCICVCVVNVVNVVNVLISSGCVLLDVWGWVCVYVCMCVGVPGKDV